MSTPAIGSGALELPPYSLDVQAMDLGNDVKAVGLELVGTENREPVRGKEGAEMWSEILPALTGQEAFVDRVRDFCKTRKIEWREAAERCIVISSPGAEELQQLFERFEAETFGIRAGNAAQAPDSALEGDLSKLGLDAYQQAYARYTFCAVCEPEDGWVTVLSQTLWPSEIIRRVRPAVQKFDVHIARPN